MRESISISTKIIHIERKNASAMLHQRKNTGNVSVEFGWIHFLFGGGIKEQEIISYDFYTNIINSK